MKKIANPLQRSRHRNTERNLLHFFVRTFALIFDVFYFFLLSCCNLNQEPNRQWRCSITITTNFIRFFRRRSSFFTFRSSFSSFHNFDMICNCHRNDTKDNDIVRQKPNYIQTTHLCREIGPFLLVLIYLCDFLCGE